MKRQYKYKITAHFIVKEHDKYLLELDMGARINEGRVLRKKKPIEKAVTFTKLKELYDSDRIVGHIREDIKLKLGGERRKERSDKGKVKNTHNNAPKSVNSAKMYSIPDIFEVIKNWQIPDEFIAQPVDKIDPFKNLFENEAE